MSEKKGISLEKKEILDDVDIVNDSNVRKSNTSLSEQTSTSIFILVSIIIFGIMIAIGYNVFSNTLHNNLESLFEESIGDNNNRLQIEPKNNKENTLKEKTPVLSNDLKKELEKLSSTGDDYVRY